MNLKVSFAALVLVAGFIGLAAPATAVEGGECSLVIAPSPTQLYVGRPCVVVSTTDYCGTQTAACKTYYVFLTPFFGGKLGTAFDTRMIWEESNGCPGLQTIATLGCPRPGPDAVVSPA